MRMKARSFRRYGGVGLIALVGLAAAWLGPRLDHVEEVIPEDVERMEGQPPTERIRSYDLDTTQLQKNLAFFLFDPAPTWKHVIVPLFGVWGAKDKLVPAEKSQDIIETALREAGSTAFDLRTLPDADHNLKGTQAEEMMIEWVLNRVRL